MKLISMTDFVLEQYSFDEQLYRDTLRNIVNYANFLKEPLKLEMFVPCDDYDNILFNPFADDNDGGTDKEYKQTQYNKAKERVLFEGYKINDNYLYYGDFMVCLLSDIELHTVEDLIGMGFKPQLTENAIKQIGL